MHLSTCYEKTFHHYHFLFTHPAGDDFDELSEDEVAVVGMKTRQMRRDEINQSLVAKQQGMLKEPWCQLHSQVINVLQCIHYVPLKLWSHSKTLLLIYH